MYINKHTIRDIILPLLVDDFSERFTGRMIVTLADMKSGYDQFTLHILDRDMTAFMTPIGLLRMTRLLQGATNSVGQFVRAMFVILEHVMDIAGAYIDDIGIEGPKTDYGGEETASGIRRYVLEHIRNMDRVLLELERAGVTLDADKT